MPDFILREVANTSPTECWICKQTVGPFIDTQVDKIEGHVLLCTSKFEPTGELIRSGCIEQMARLVGMRDVVEQATLDAAHADTVAQLLDQIADLEEALEKAGEVLGPAELEKLRSDLEDSVAAMLQTSVARLEETLGRPAKKPA